VEQRIMDAAGVQAQQYDSEVNDRDQVFVDCVDTHANTEPRHGRPSDTEETDPCRSVISHKTIKLSDLSSFLKRFNVKTYLRVYCL